MSARGSSLGGRVDRLSQRTLRLGYTLVGVSMLTYILTGIVPLSQEFAHLRTFKNDDPDSDPGAAVGVR